MPASLPLSERIHQACPCRLINGNFWSCGDEDFCRCAAPNSTMLPECLWEGHALAGEVDDTETRAKKAEATIAELLPVPDTPDEVLDANIVKAYRNMVCRLKLDLREISDDAKAKVEALTAKVQELESERDAFTAKWKDLTGRAWRKS